jgi:hypothetical protein
MRGTPFAGEPGVLKVKGAKLTEVPGSPFSGTLNGSLAFGLVAVPSQTCK